MAQIYNAEANPEKRLFISLITRDISLADAIIDLTDNSVNAAMRSVKNPFSSTEDFHRLFTKKNLDPEISIKVVFDQNHITVSDDASGIDFELAMHEVFRFGHQADGLNSKDRLSVYGIGMKRALFKIGNKVSVTSDHKNGGFSLILNVEEWERNKSVPWTFPITKRSPNSTTGTSIVIRDLHDEVKKRVASEQFKGDLIDKLSRVYSFYIGRVIKITVNGELVPRTDFEIGGNFSHDKFRSSNVDCLVTAGIASPSGGQFLENASGWFVLCNFRTVLYADKTPLTGWGDSLPLFQPKHRPFLGMVAFVSSDPEALPWTTTKGGINVDNLAWQEATLRMAAVAKPVLRLLDTRYTSEGTDVSPTGLVELAGKSENIFESTVSKVRTFSPATRQVPQTVKIQYDAKRSELESIKKHFGMSSLSASGVGRRTFDYFLRNVVEQK